MMISLCPTLLFPQPASLFITSMSLLGCFSLANAGYMETKGQNMPYSKFFNIAALKKSKDQKVMLPSRNGMLLLYTPALFVGLASFAIFHDQDLRFVMLTYVLTLHFLKRVLEVLLVHKYSGSMALETAITICLSYTISTATTIYAQYLSQQLPEPTMDLKYVGIGLFLIGLVGNFYHHYLLSTLRTKGDRDYKIPNGGLFDLVICPHYLFEIVEFIGITCIAQTTSSLCVTAGTIFYLAGRSYATREWYRSKFGDKFDKDIKALIPYVF